MYSDFSVFRERLAHACRVRNLTQDRLCASIGLGSRRRVDLAASGLKALNIYRLAQIADRLEVSVDWLLGRSDVMEVPKGDGKRLA
jgi:transcriptional regulator with XRE-family HTH domain